MQDKTPMLTEAEWQIMEFLWEHGSATGRQATESIEEQKGWNRSTTLTLLSRLEAKGAVITTKENGKKVFIPAIRQDDARLQEAKRFLKWAYKGSLSMMVSSLTEEQALTSEEIDELYDLLKSCKEN